MRARRLASRCPRSDQHRGCAIEAGEQAFQRLELWQIVDHDVGVARIAGQEILMVILGGSRPHRTARRRQAMAALWRRLCRRGIALGSHPLRP
jgi:hypothetical protein